ncbi:MAG: hypothetical protein K5873_09165 [Treponema sp.]|nr:hypothetical protein [Treponema sp.]
MANGEEDLKEKNKDSAKEIKTGQYSQWSNFQGREDAEMLYEKRNSWTNARSAKDFYNKYDKEDD